ncbi:serine/threonine-protein kinase EDR1-like [Cynara cardunculus var. scolymus]|uniref:serine/threonine-protein kinase EDR1-like n=1 Tax=Cynara cardunculus var. scolymus TaxID=59895 RepID=UPI000D629EED|nr:serine/threonine-protein kinase EDR1-like [Cynara cardunculus var. scolymus]XP_024961097.1 serine/threonine-protein kinase EDR1-like [Cynara cardunculus var. scolymus]
MDTEETRDELGTSEHGPSSNTWWPSEFVDKFGSVSLDSKKETLNHRRSMSSSTYDRFLSQSQSASQILWSTGVLSEPIPNGFYSVIHDKRLKDLFDDIPTLEELHDLELEGVKADIILVDAQKDKKLSMLKQLIATLVKGLNSNPAAIIKKIAGLVSDFYKRPQFDSPIKATVEDVSHVPGSRGAQLLGHIKNGSCRPRAILFKVLADTVGFESRLVVGLPNEGVGECVDSYKHMSVVVVLNSVELLVDLMRFPGQLIPRSTKAIFMTHISGAGESDSAENDSCDSPLEPNSPLYGFSERMDNESSEKDDNLLYQRRLESSLNAPGPSLRNKMMRSSSSIDGKWSLSHSEPDIAATFWRRSRRKVISEPRTASSSPEHPSFRARGRSMLSGDRRSFRDYPDDVGPSRSEGTSTSEHRRNRRRSISITPEIGDDIVRAVRAMNETLKQNRLSREQVDSRLQSADVKKDESDFRTEQHDGRSLYSLQREHVTSQKAMSLPSSPHEFRHPASGRPGISDGMVPDETVSTWNKILDSPMFQNKPLLPYQEWNIDFSELTVGTRVGIGFFGEVFRGIWNGTEVAIKVFLEQDLTAENMEDFCNEISILSRLRHPNVILFLGACTRPPRLSMITEYMEMGSLYYLIHLSGQKKKLSWRRRLKMLRDICRGLMCIHRMKIAHRDIKSANCLVNKHWTIKICDFGLSRMMTESPMKDTSSAGTPEWMAPELIRNEPFTEKCDIFSLGVIMWELCTLNRPWEGLPPERVVYSVANEGSRLEIPEGPLGRLIADCWAEPHERPSCEDILTRLLDCEYSLC